MVSTPGSLSRSPTFTCKHEEGFINKSSDMVKKPKFVFPGNVSHWERRTIETWKYWDLGNIRFWKIGHQKHRNS